jgi:transcriptional regulator with XRE-family HTH domain
MNHTKALDMLLAEQVKELRERHGRRQDDLARGARRCGLRWTRATVAALEAGRRRLSALETLLLPAVLTYGLGINPALDAAAIIPERAAVRLPDGTLVEGRTLRGIIRGEVSTTPWAVPGTPEFRQVEAVRTRREARTRIFAQREAAGDAEQKAAAKLGRPPLQIAVAARKLWGRSLTDERDRRVAEQAPGEVSSRALQALRGHITRALLLELGRHIASGRSRINKRR